LETIKLGLRKVKKEEVAVIKLGVNAVAVLGLESWVG